MVITVKNGDKARAVKVAGDLADLGFRSSPRRARRRPSRLPACREVVNKVKDGRPHIADMVKAGEIQLVFTTVDETRTAIADSRYIRTAALAHRVTYYTTMAGCEAAVEALKHQDGLRRAAAGTARRTALNLRSSAAVRPVTGLHWRRFRFCLRI